MERTASAHWSGDLKTGKGELSTASGILKNTPYSFVTRFENTPGTNPEELIAAAHAGCFTMALSAMLGEAGFTAKELLTTAKVKLEHVEDHWAITTIHLDLTANIANIDEKQFQAIVDDAKANCPVSRVLNAKITLNAILV